MALGLPHPTKSLPDFAIRSRNRIIAGSGLIISSTRARKQRTTAPYSEFCRDLLLYI